MNYKTTEYTPGVCNIGPDEIRMRLITGWTGAGLTIVTGVLLFFLHSPAPTGVLIFFPAMAGAVGFFQAGFHFCAAYGIRGVFNVIGKTGNTTAVTENEFLGKDRQKAIQILLLSLSVAVMLTAIMIILLLL